MKLKYLILGLLPMLAACSSESDEPASAAEPVELQLELSVSAMAESRATYSTLAEGTCIALLLQDAVTNETVDKCYGVVNSEGSVDSWLDFTNNAATTLYFPISGHDVNIFAITGTKDNLLNWNWDTNSSLAFDTGSDILIARKTAALTKAPIRLVFEHQVTKIEVTLSGASELITSLDLVDVPNNPFAKWSGRDLTLSPTIFENYTMTHEILPNVNEVILLPFDVGIGIRFISVTLSDGKELSWATSSDFSFEAGKSYRFDVTVDANNLAVTTSVTDWTDNGSNTGNGYYAGNTIEAVDLGLSVKWANCNSGAVLPIDYGSYFTWSTSNLSQVTTDWGSGWRAPTKEEIEELLTLENYWGECDGVVGCWFEGNGNAIFLPACGGGNAYGYVWGQGEYGYYWSSTERDGYRSYGLRIVNSGAALSDSMDRWVTYAMRPVYDI